MDLWAGCGKCGRSTQGGVGGLVFRWYRTGLMGGGGEGQVIGSGWSGRVFEKAVGE